MLLRNESEWKIARSCKWKDTARPAAQLSILIVPYAKYIVVQVFLAVTRTRDICAVISFLFHKFIRWLC